MIPMSLEDLEAAILLPEEGFTIWIRRHGRQVVTELIASKSNTFSLEASAPYEVALCAHHNVVERAGYPAYLTVWCHKPATCLGYCEDHQR